MRYVWMLSAVLMAAGSVVLVWLTVAPPLVVNDGAQVLSDSQRAVVARHHEELLTRHDIDYRFVTVRGVSDLDRFAYNEFKTLLAGLKSESGKGLLILFDADTSLFRLEVNKEVHDLYASDFVAQLDKRIMVPYLAAGRPDKGLVEISELVVARARTGPPRGARARFPDRRLPAPGGNPAETLIHHFAAMDGNKAGALRGIYTPETQAMLSEGAGKAVMRGETLLQSYRNCRVEAIKESPERALAVIRYPASQEHCAPWFFRKLDGRWVLDLTLSGTALRIKPGGGWRFDKSIDHPYGFAFDDWQFDDQGFPVK